jgi:hypothetical protein
MKKLLMLFLVTSISYIQGSEVGAQTKTIKKNKIEPKEASDSEDTPKKKKKGSKTLEFEDVDGYTAPGVAVAAKIDYYNVVKLNPWGAVMGMYSGSYERVLTPRFSGELTLGMTKLNNRHGYITMTDLWNDAKPAFFNNASIQTLETGLVLGLTVRYYGGGRTHIPEGAYFMGGVQMRSYRFTENAFVRPDVRGQTLVPSSLTETDLIRVIFGHQAITRSGFIWDLYVGLAYRKLTSDGPYSTSTQVFNGQRTLTSDPILLLGCKVGMAF